MEDLIGIGIFVTIVVVTLLNRAQEKKRREAEEREARENGGKAEDLPEAARRMLHGEEGEPGPGTARPGVRVAKPARPGETESSPERPRGIEAFLRDLLPPEPGERAAQPPPAPPGRRGVVERPPLQTPAFRPVEGEPARSKPEAPRAPRPGRPAPQQRRPEPAQRPVVIEQRKRPARPKRRPAATRQRRLKRALFSNMDDVRRGIILSEILGPPVSLR